MPMHSSLEIERDHAERRVEQPPVALVEFYRYFLRPVRGLIAATLVGRSVPRTRACTREDRHLDQHLPEMLRAEHRR